MISFTVSSFPTVVIWMTNSVGSGRNVCLPVRRARRYPATIIPIHTMGVSQAMRISAGIRSPYLHGIVALLDGGHDRKLQTASFRPGQERFEILREACSSERT